MPRIIACKIRNFCINSQFICVEIGIFASADWFVPQLYMPTLEKIIVNDFRNIEFQELEFSSKINCISGNNGEGKTNLLDAIYYLSMTKSAFSTSDRYNFRHGFSSFSIAGTYRMENSLVSRFSIQCSSDGAKKLRRDDKVCARVSEHIGKLPVVMVSPSDTSLVSESGEERRRFVNSVLSQMSPEYLSSLQQYNRVLQQRNRLLKDSFPDADVMAVLDSRLSVFADPVYKARKSFAEKLQPIVASYFSSLSGVECNVGVNYRSDISAGNLADQLAAGYDRDRMLKYTGCGVHRDDFIFEMDGYPIRRCGSQGQQKSFLVALKFAQYDIMKANYGFAPMLLLDDVFDKLDMSRISNLLRMVVDREFGQIFVTDSNKVRMASMVNEITDERAYFETSGGCFTKTVI